MLFKALLFLIVSLCTSVQISPSNTELANGLREASRTGVDWNAVVADMRAGIDDGLEEGRRHAENSVDLPETKREVANEEYRDKLIARFKHVFWASTVDPYKIVYAVSAIASGVVAQVVFGTTGMLQEHFDPDLLLGNSLSISYLFAIQGLVMALMSSLDTSALPMKLRNVPKPALLGGVFSALSVSAAVASLPIVGFEMGSMIILFTQMASGLCLDGTGFFGYSATRNIEKGQILGAMFMAGGFLTTLGDDMESQGMQPFVALLPFFGLVACSGVAGPVVSALNGAVVPYAGSVLKAAALARFVGMATMMVIALTLSFVKHTPAFDFEGLQWWAWVGGLLGSYSVWTVTALPKKLGLSAYFALENIGYIGAASLSDSFGIFGERRPYDAAKALGVALVIFGMGFIQIFKGDEISPARISMRLAQEGAVEMQRGTDQPAPGVASDSLQSAAEDLGAVDESGSEFHPEYEGEEAAPRSGAGDESAETLSIWLSNQEESHF